jgi:hypothetical protein
MSFDQEPDGDLHGECTAEIHQLELELAACKLELEKRKHEDGILLVMSGNQCAELSQHCAYLLQMLKGYVLAMQSGNPDLLEHADKMARIAISKAA